MDDNSSFIPRELLYEVIVDSSDDVIISKDLKGTIKSWNKGAERIFGYHADEIVGQSVTKLLPPDRPDEEAQILARLQKGERLDHFETQRQRKDGQLIDVSLTISPIRNAEGVIVGASKIARDITQQKEAGRQLAETHEQLKRAERMKTEFVATLSHELRTPLNAILGWVQILKDPGSTADDLATGLPVIERNVRAQSQLIEDLLDMSRIEAGKISLDVQRVDLAEVVNAGLETVRPAATANHIRLTSAFSDVQGIVMGDKGRLQQIVWNLLSNAVKFTPKGGRIHVVIKRVNSHVEICVTDSGKGIAPEFLGEVFERFRQADATTTRRYGGLGLGLAIVKHLTELHGGAVCAASDGADQGAAFTVSLPLQPLRQEPEALAAADRNAAVDGSAITADLHGVKVLVVDDEDDSVAAVLRILRRRRAEVRGAHSMAAALEAFTDFAPDVVLSDIGMPEHDGYELIARLRALPGGRAIPVVALTALARSEDRTRALRAGFQMHVAKPVDFTELVAVVQNLASLRAGKE
ncbi:MAG: PAS domain S-box protein [Chthoniobacterales bacterium]|nr:PAS domain S-box protein [Chthoniobacterales bacterium]